MIVVIFDRALFGGVSIIGGCGGTNFNGFFDSSNASRSNLGAWPIDPKLLATLQYTGKYVSIPNGTGPTM